jgi:hypothetical protein
MYNCWEDNEWELKISYYFQSNSAKNHRTMTQFELDLRISLMSPYVKFELNV